MLQDCLHTFQDAHDVMRIGNTLSALASIEVRRGHGDAAIRLERDALRHSYLAGDVTGIVASYVNLGTYLHRHTSQPAAALAAHLAAALIRILVGTGPGDELTNTLAIHLRLLGTAAVPPTSVADLDRQLGDIPGTDLPALIASLSPGAETADRTLRDLIAQVQVLSATSASGKRGHAARLPPGASAPRQRGWGYLWGRRRPAR
jgi:hypothetical protein